MRFICLFLIYLFSLSCIAAQQSVQAQVLDATTKEPLIGVHIAYANGRYGTATNASGKFQLNFSTADIGDSLRFSYIGYEALAIPITSSLLQDLPSPILLAPASAQLPAVQVEVVNPFLVVESAYQQIATNYRQDAYQMVGFYREQNIQQQPHKRTLLFTEGVLAIQKDEFNERRSRIKDEVSLLKGYRRDLPFYLLDEKKQPLAMTPIRQGAYLPVRVDVVREDGFLFSRNNYKHYNYTFEKMDVLDGRLLYRIRFEANRKKLSAIYRGTLYIDKETFAVVKADYDYNVRGLYRFNRNNLTPLTLSYRQFSCEYALYEGQWFLSRAHVKQSFRDQASNIPVLVLMTYITTEIDSKERTTSTGNKVYFEDVLAASVDAVTKNYWEEYIILESEVDDD